MLRDSHGFDRDEARAFMTRTDEARATFIHTCFEADVDDQRSYDLVINTGSLDSGMVLELCEFLVRAKRLSAMEAEG